MLLEDPIKWNLKVLFVLCSISDFNIFKRAWRFWNLRGLDTQRYPRTYLCECTSIAQSQTGRSFADGFGMPFRCPLACQLSVQEVSRVASIELVTSAFAFESWRQSGGLQNYFLDACQEYIREVSAFDFPAWLVGWRLAASRSGWMVLPVSPDEGIQEGRRYKVGPCLVLGLDCIARIRLVVWRWWRQWTRCKCGLENWFKTSQDDPVFQKTTRESLCLRVSLRG